MLKQVLKSSALSLAAIFVISCGADKNKAVENKKVETDPNLLSFEQLSKEKVYETIEDAVKDGDKVYRLHIKYNTLKKDGKFPEEIMKLKNLQDLNIGGNEIKSLPDNFGDLKFLQYLDLGGNPLEKLPESIGNLKFLKNFTLNNAQIPEYPASIVNMGNLEKLECVSCDLEKFQVEITKLTNLKEINFNSNLITSIPAEIANLGSLQYLGLMFNKLKAIPSEIGKLKSLDRLHILDNQIEEIPASVGDLSNLTELLASRNKFSKLPESISKLSKLNSIDIGGNKNLDYAQALTVIAKLPELRILQMGSMGGNMNAEATMPKEIANIKVKSLSLGFTKFTNLDAAFENIGKISGLETLTASDCNITKIPAAMFKMTGLKMILLSGNKIQKSDFDNLVKALPKTNIPNIFR